MKLPTYSFPTIVLFDLDGTLLDNSKVVVDAYYTGLEHLNYEPPHRNEIAKLAGKNTFETARALGVSDEDIDKMDRWFWQYFDRYCKHLQDTPELLPGVTEVLEFLTHHQVKLGIVTSNSARNAKLLLEKVGLLQLFSVVVGKEDTQQHKPDPAPIRYALSHFDLSDSVVWMIGDTASDVKAAKSAGIISIAVPQDHSVIEVESTNPDLTFTSLILLLEFMKSV